MPTYDYDCATCDKTFEVFQKMSDEKLKACPTCGKPVTRRIGTGAGLVFKGGGFYETDFKTKKGSKPKDETKTTVSTTTPTTDTKKSDSNASSSSASAPSDRKSLK